jgi:hypothetical protein
MMAAFLAILAFALVLVAVVVQVSHSSGGAKYVTTGICIISALAFLLYSAKVYTP